MRVRRSVILKFKGKEAKVDALFDTGSSFTVMSTRRFVELFKCEDWFTLARPYYAYLLNGNKIKLDKYVIISIIIDDHEIVDLVHLSDDIVTHIRKNGKLVKLPDIIIGAGTMDKYGIEISAEKGVIFRELLLI